jgi:hypothetical protein
MSGYGLSEDNEEANTQPGLASGESVWEGFQHRLREAVRRAFGGVNSALEKKAGIPHTTFQAWIGRRREAGLKPPALTKETDAVDSGPTKRRQLSVEHLWGLARKAGLSLDYLVTGEGALYRGSVRAPQDIEQDLAIAVRASCALSPHETAMIPAGDQLFAAAVEFANWYVARERMRPQGYPELEAKARALSLDDALASELLQDGYDRDGPGWS